MTFEAINWNKIEGLIDHQQAAIDAAAEAWWRRDYPEYGPWQDAVAERPEWASEIRADCAAELTAAAPHLRAAWEQPIRELCEAAIKRANDPLAARGFYGEAFPATVYAQDILALLEGGGACCEHSKCPGGSICCCQEGGGE